MVEAFTKKKKRNLAIGRGVVRRAPSNFLWQQMGPGTADIVKK